MRLSVVRIEVQRDIRLGRGSVKIFLPQIEDGSDVVHEGDLRTLLQGQVEMTLGLLERLAPVVRPMELPVQNLGKRQASIGFAVARIFADRFLKEIGRPLERIAVPDRPPQRLAPSQEKIVRLAVGRFDVAEPHGFARAQLDLEGVNNPVGDLVLDREDVAELAIEAVGSNGELAAAIKSFFRFLEYRQPAALVGEDPSYGEPYAGLAFAHRAV